MDVKGTAVQVTEQFILSEFKEDGKKRWLSALSPDARQVFEKGVLATSWYPAQLTVVEPTRAMCDLFFAGNLEGAWKLGRFSAEIALSGVYKIFLALAPPHVVIDRGVRILATYYRPLKATVAESRPGRVAMVMADMDEPSAVIDNRVAGWMQRAFELCGVKHIDMAVVQSAKDRATVSELVGTWTPRCALTVPSCGVSSGFCRNPRPPRSKWAGKPKGYACKA